MDTIWEVPTFSEFVDVDSSGRVDLDGRHSEYLRKIKSLIYVIFSIEIFFSVVGDFIVLFDSRSGKPIGEELLSQVDQLTHEKVELRFFPQESQRSLVVG